MQEFIRSAFLDSIQAMQQFISEDNLNQLKLLSQDMASLFERRSRVLICGNGGSHCDAMHFAEELTGRFRKERGALPAMALGDAAHITCVANDYGFDEIFKRHVEAFGNAGDMLIGLSTSGNSANVEKALKEAHNMGLKTVAFLGKDGGVIKGLCDYEFIVSGETSDRIQEVHMAALHIIIEAVERQLYPDNY
ncbi:MAG: D-sedoheptulose 7-phosphate isomerase [Planctomycetes bacterium]|nr:D-sedoheptulose 7-phosphate isomerase [Planctomycetota bacterium]